MSTPDNKLVQNLEKQLERLVEQINDLEECKNEISKEEYDLIHLDTLEQIQEFEISLEKLQKGNMTLNSKFSLMREAIRNAISKNFNTTNLKQNFEGNEDLEEKLKSLEENFLLKRIDEKYFCDTKVKILQKIILSGHTISEENSEFLKKYEENPYSETLEPIE